MWQVIEVGAVANLIATSLEVTNCVKARHKLFMLQGKRFTSYIASNEQKLKLFYVFQGKEKTTFREKLDPQVIKAQSIAAPTVPEGIDDACNREMWFEKKVGLSALYPTGFSDKCVLCSVWTSCIRVTL